MKQSSPYKRPNVCFIYVDDQAAWTIGAYGNEEAHTPNLDQLAAEGALMENAFCSTPVCSPARAAMLTGRYSTETGIPDFIPHPNHIAHTEAWHGVGVGLDMKTFPSVLADNGYETALFGKWHVGDWTLDPDQRFHPTKNGYNYFFGMTGGGVSPENPEFEEDGVLKTFEGYCDEILTERAVQYLQTKAEDGDTKPFMLSLNLRQPHHPWNPVPECDMAHYRDKELKLPDPDYPDLDIEHLQERMRGYMAGVSGVDRMVGQIMDALEQNGLSENTILIFSADHGFMMGHNGLHHKGNGLQATRTKDKNPYVPNVSESSLNVPCLVRWPSHIQAGQRHDAMLSDVDWFPTVLELAGCELPEDVTVRGSSWAPMLLGGSVDGWRDAVYSEYDMCVYAHSHLRALRSERWKLVLDFHNPWRSAFYDMQTDDPEAVNLIAANSGPLEYQLEVKAAIREMSEKLIEIMSEKQDSFAEYWNQWESR
ncbi:sulfatase-like hydrolase/transferase [Coraliomargarita sp. SDUM461004]|uniref:Sulfatase-like hydrolase/transferase n=1 Tax=Thalassobacterium sedimentorum TaxID=3041258 RepID=A0ABU1AIR1_9BACT|nr:sulfatase-like hydrolase/transferase [Coraliomargarita sp. SDUM461004]MDQ8194058.1 sulfatase-like hydrolase/transferase [Coraliomargarita sp. SDUM461004]